jgi:drug/metabolite transporter (DMT)-like permease
MDARPGLAWLAFVACSLIWGSTWLAHKWALTDFTPAGLSSLRFLVAGVLCLALARARGERWVAVGELPSLLGSGLLLVGVANVLTAWTLQHIPSGVGAVLQAPIPLWLALLSWRSDPLPALGWLAASLGALGVAWVMWPSGPVRLDFFAALVCALTPMLWSIGALHQRRHVHSGGLFGNVGLQMLCSGSLGAVLTPWLGGYTQQGAVGLAAALALGYLVVFGSCIAFAAYVYLSRVWHPARAGSFAYLNPLVAVLLGWALAGEAVSVPLFGGMALVLASVALLQWVTPSAAAAAPARGTRR